MKVVADEDVDPEFGTGIMKVTPAHDTHDFELGKRYNLPVTPIIDFQGRMDFTWFLEQQGIDPQYRARAEKYHGKKIAEARKLIVEDLKEDGLLVKTDEKYLHTVGTCYRCGTIIEPLPLPQFFVKVQPLTAEVLKALDNGETKVIGAGHDKILRHWLENLKDWNISRQIVWGIRMPIWYDVTKNPEMQLHFLDQDGKRISGRAQDVLKNYKLELIQKNLQELRAPMAAEFEISLQSPGENFIQETDTFDTWFSSAQWPFTILKANQEDDFKNYYPTQVMETGYDILPFWVMRMLMMGLFKTGKVPFETVYMHGLVRDQKGQKMSKSKGNVINPLTVIEQYGADALRMAVVIRSSAGLDKSVGDPDFRAMRNLTNKIWNAARFVLTSLPAESHTENNDPAFFEKLTQITQEVTQQLEDFKIGLAAETVYNEFWHWYCDVAIEQAKAGTYSSDAMRQGLVTFLKLIHPFMPFVTEAVWQELQRDQKALSPLIDQPVLTLTHWPKMPE